MANSSKPSATKKKTGKKTDPCTGRAEKGIVQNDAVRGLLVQTGDPPEWREAVYHNDIRDELLAIASNNGRDQYDYPRERGMDWNDQTAFLAEHRHWRSEPEHWHLITDDILNRVDRAKYPRPKYPIVPMMHNGRIVLDKENYPVRVFHQLPLTLSSQMEGWLLEAITRLDLRIEKTDIRARMVL